MNEKLSQLPINRSKLNNEIPLADQISNQHCLFRTSYYETYKFLYEKTFSDFFTSLNMKNYKTSTHKIFDSFKKTQNAFSSVFEDDFVMNNSMTNDHK